MSHEKLLPRTKNEVQRSSIASLPSSDAETATEEEKELAEGCARLRQLVQDMHRRIVVFTSPQHYEQEMLSTLVPLINDKFAGIDEESLQLLHLEAYERMVRYHAGQRGELVSNGKVDVPRSLQTLERWRPEGGMRVWCTRIDT